MPDAKDRGDVLDWAGTTPSDEGLSGLDPVVADAKRRFNRGMKWESTARMRWLQDLKFSEGDSDNFYQWPDQIRRNRDVEAEPCITVNKTRQHNLQIINDAKQNKPGIKVSAVGNGATAEAAKCLNGLFRHIESKSGAQYAYMLATEFQVKAGKGFIRVLTDYVGSGTMDQEILIEPVPDPLTVVMDPDCKYRDRRDARWAIVFEDVPRDEFLTHYPEYRRNPPAKGALGMETDWISQDKIRVAEYYRIHETEAELFRFIDKESGDWKYLYDSDLEQIAKGAPELVAKIKEDPQTSSRKVFKRQLEWYKIIGEEIEEERKLPGKFIPVVPVVGEETTLEGLYDCKGHTRALKDPQRTYNYWTSSSVQYGALQSKTPYVAPALAIEGLETYWETANTENHSILPYNHLDDEGQAIPAPSRQMPPVASDACLKGLQIAGQEMQMVSGQYQAMMGQPSNERSAKAINERQRQGDNSTYGYIDNLGLAVTHVARIVLDLVPHVYDTERTVLIQGEDGVSMEVQIDPMAQQAFQQKLNHLGEVAKLVLNPQIGDYWVVPDMGPSWGTKRQEASNAFSLIMAENPAVASIVADLYFSNMDFDGAEVAAERFRHLLPPQASGQGPTPQETQQQQLLQALQANLAKTHDELTKLRLELKGKSEMRDIDAHEAETKRLAVMGKLAPMDSNGLQQLVHQLVGDALKTHIGQIQQDNEAELETQRQADLFASTSQQPGSGTPSGAGSGAPSGALPAAGGGEAPIPGAIRNSRGEWFVPHPTAHGKWAKVLPRV